MLRHEEEYQLPLHLQGGSRFTGVVTGALDRLDVKGHASLQNVVYQGILFEQAAAKCI
jgi:hypothetical protein